MRNPQLPPPHTRLIVCITQGAKSFHEAMHTADKAAKSASTQHLKTVAERPASSGGGGGATADASPLPTNCKETADDGVSSAGTGGGKADDAVTANK